VPMLPLVAIGRELVLLSIDRGLLADDSGLFLQPRNRRARGLCGLVARPISGPELIHRRGDARVHVPYSPLEHVHILVEEGAVILERFCPMLGEPGSPFPE